MSKKDREGMSKRQELREKHRQAEQRNRLIWIGVIIIGALLVAFFLIYPQIKPITAIQPATFETRPNVNRNSTGDPNAPVKLVEYTDFQCPYCKQYWQDTEPQIINAYVKTGKVFYTVRSSGNFISNGANKQTNGNDTESQDSAMAAYCAADQNKYWEMHDALFTNVLGEADGISFMPQRLQAIAQNMKLDMNAYNSCFSSQKYLNQVNQDFQNAQAASMQGTPFFVISYIPQGQTQSVTNTLIGAQPFSAFQQALGKALSASGAQ
ncbi:MAG TPA: thioredoxin domain-containing protein [Anaerolineales bacterium]